MKYKFTVSFQAPAECGNSVLDEFFENFKLILISKTGSVFSCFEKSQLNQTSMF